MFGDGATIPELLRLACDESVAFLNGVHERPAKGKSLGLVPLPLPALGMGATDIARPRANERGDGHLQTVHSLW